VALVSVGCSKKEAPQPPTAASPPRTFPHAIGVTTDTPHQIGSFDSSKKAMVTKQNEVGAVVFGPYLPLELGNYRAVFKVSAEGSGEEAVGKVDVNAFSDATPENPIAADDIKPARGEQRVTVDFSGVAGMKYEFRIWANGKGMLSAKEVVIEKKG